MFRVFDELVMHNNNNSLAFPTQGRMDQPLDNRYVHIFIANKYLQCPQRISIFWQSIDMRAAKW